MYKARFTKDGARRMSLPHLVGQVFQYESLHPKYPVVLEMYYQGERIGSNLSYATGEESQKRSDNLPGCELITRPGG